MGSLFAGLSIAVRAMLAEGSAAQVVSENIANINTPGYSRRLPVFSEEIPGDTTVFGGGSGVTLSSVRAVRDRVLDLRIAAEMQCQSGLQTFQDAMQPVERLFDPSSESGIGASLNQFFAALRGLAADPSSAPLRQNVLVCGESLAASVRSAVQQAHTAQLQAQSQAEQAAQEATACLQHIANLNRDIAAAQLQGASADGFLDQRATALQELSKLMNVAVFDSEQGLTITARDGTALVIGQQSFGVDVTLDGNTGHLQVLADRKDITAGITGGQIGGLLQARDCSMERVLTELDRFAFAFTNAFNTQHRQGFTLDSSAGDDFFTPSTIEQGAAASMSVGLTDPSDLACSSDGQAGSGGNLAKLSALAQSAVIIGQKSSDYLAGIGFRIGSEISQAHIDVRASETALQQLQAQRSALSGVSLDEEAANLIRYQRAFQAAAHVFTVIDELTQTVLAMRK